MADKKESKKRRVVHRERVDFVKVCAFWGILFAALVMFINFIIALLNFCGISISAFSTINGILNILSMVALLIAVAFPAYNYVRGKGRNWRIVYWIALVMYICGIIGIGFTI